MLRSKTTVTESGTGTTEVLRTHRRFSPLFLAPVPGLLFAWVLHVWTRGVHWGPIDTPGSEGVTAGLGVSLGALAVVLAGWAWVASAHRQGPVRAAFAASTGSVTLLFAANMWAGPDYWLSGLFLVLSFTVATVWGLTRTNVARNDKQQGEQQGERETFLERLGISKSTNFKAKVVHDEKGEPARLEVQVKHADGQTTAALQNNLSAIESQVASETGLPVPSGMSTASVTDKADESTMTVLLNNPFKGHRPLGPLTNPGKSIAEWTSFADYDDGRPFFMTIAAGLHIPGSCSYCIAGMTRAGKTVAENQMLTDWLSRIDFCLLYLNQAKGRQDARPLLPAAEAVVIAADGEQGHGEYIAAGKSVQKIMRYREGQLSRFGVSAWSPRCADPDPAKRPSIPDPASPLGIRVVMERMPFLVAHFGEADSILAGRGMSELAVHVASKGLSLGVSTGWSLQSPSYRSMDTDLRRNLGMRLCFGVSDDDAADFMLDSEYQQAGAKPQRWGQRKPGQFYAQGPGIDDERVPHALKTRFLVGDEKHPDGTPVTFDELNDRYQAELLRRNEENAKTVCKLDRGSADATDGWWDDRVEKTDQLRAEMLRGVPRTDPAPTPHADPAQAPRTDPARPRTMADADPAPARPRTTPHVEDDADAIDPAEVEENMTEFMNDVKALHGDEPSGDPDIDGLRDELYPAGDTDADEVRRIGVADTPALPAGGPDPLADSAEDDKPAAKTKQEAVAAVRQTLVSMFDDPGRVEKDGTVLTGPTEVHERCGLRSRPWVSEVLTALMLGGGELSDEIVMEHEGSGRKSRYRLRRIAHSK